MDTENDTGTKASPYWTGWIVSLGFILGFVTLCMGLTFPVHALFLLLTGWTSQAMQLVNEGSASLPELVSSLLLIAVIAVLLHFALRVLFRRYTKQSEDMSKTWGWQRRWSLSLVVILALLVVSGICVLGISHQTWQLATSDEPLLFKSGFTAARRSASKNNLKQIGLAFHNYHDAFDRLPVGGDFNRIGEPQHSWVTHLLPYLDQGSLYNQIDFSQPWKAEVNRSPFETRVYVMENLGVIHRFENGKRRAENQKGYQPSHYAANNQILNVNTGMKLRDIKDGASDTILAGEVSTGIKAWGDPTNFRNPQLGINASPNGFGGPYQWGAHFLLVDGSVRFISDDIDPQILKALATPNGGETVGEY
ncbi:DUF1559 domain-containing protein [Gimesia sp.]|uniref:DUF1559 domain-containing protein n=1 Tax=Gimesia sp. TaxID=2024833 RepID=UPI003A8F933B